MDALDTWLNFRERALHESDVGNSIDIIEEQLRKHEDFEQMVLAQETKFGDINRLTLVSPPLPVQHASSRLSWLLVTSRVVVVVGAGDGGSEEERGGGFGGRTATFGEDAIGGEEAEGTGSHLAGARHVTSLLYAILWQICYLLGCVLY